MVQVPNMTPGKASSGFTTTPGTAARSLRPSTGITLDGGFAEHLPQWQHEAIGRRVRQIADAIETQVVPALVCNRRAGARRMRAAPHPAQPLGFERRALTRMILAEQEDEAGAEAAIDALTARGVPAGTICDTVLAGCGQDLGRMWDEDRCTSVDVTLGLGLLQRLVWRLAPAFLADRAESAASRCIVLALGGGEDGFSAALVRAHLMRAGWDVVLPASDAPDEIIRTARGAACRILCLTAAPRSPQRALAARVEAIRRAAGAASPVAIMIGGPLFETEPDQAFRGGADAGFADGRGAVASAEALRETLLAVG